MKMPYRPTLRPLSRLIRFLFPRTWERIWHDGYEEGSVLAEVRR